MAYYSDTYGRDAPRLDMDQLFDRSMRRDLARERNTKLVLARAHARIRRVARQHNHTPWCWFTVPEYIVGSSRFDSVDCTEYVVSALEQNGFRVGRHPCNTLLISWRHWVPQYERDAIFRRTGVRVDKFGHRIPDPDEDEDGDGERREAEAEADGEWMGRGPMSGYGLGGATESQWVSATAAAATTTKAISRAKHKTTGRPRPATRDTGGYKPSGKLVYDPDMLDLDLDTRIAGGADPEILEHPGEVLARRLGQNGVNRDGGGGGGGAPVPLPPRQGSLTISR